MLYVQAECIDQYCITKSQEKEYGRTDVDYPNYFSYIGHGKK